MTFYTKADIIQNTVFAYDIHKTVFYCTPKEKNTVSRVLHHSVYQLIKIAMIIEIMTDTIVVDIILCDCIRTCLSTFPTVL